MVSASLGQMLKGARKHAKMTQEQVASAMGAILGESVNYMRYQRMETKAQEPSAEEMAALIQVLGLNEQDAWRCYKQTFGVNGVERVVSKILKTGRVDVAHRLLGFMSV